MLFTRYHILCCLYSLLSCTAVFSQPLKRLSHITYNVNEGLLQSQITDMTEDGNGFIWITSGGGLQRFDGRSFHHIPVTTNSNGIPDDRQVRFFRLKSGNIWLSHQKGISEYNSITNKFRTLKEIKPGTYCSAFTEEEDGIWYWFSQKGLYKLDKKTNQFTDSITGRHQSLFGVSYGRPVFTGRYFVQFGENMVLLTDRYTQKTSLVSSPGNKRYFFATEKYTGDTILVATARGIEKLDCRSGIFTLLHTYKTNPRLVNILHPVQLKLISASTCLVSEANKLFELDLLSGSYTAQLINLQNQDFIEIGYITSLFHDSHNNVWVISENDGIRKVNYRFAGFRYFGTAVRKNNYVKAIHAHKQDNRVLCGTFGEGLLIFDTAQHLLKEVKYFPGIKGPVTVCGFIRTAAHHYLVIIMGTWDLYEINTVDFSIKKINTVTTAIRSQVTRDHFPDYHLSVFAVNDSVSILQTGYHVNKLVWVKGRAILSELDSLDNASVSSQLLRNRQLWVGSYGRYYISNPDFTHFREMVLSGNKLVRCFAEKEKGGIWMGTEKGLYLLNSAGEILKVFTKADGLPDENIYAMQTDRQQNLWLSHNKGISCRKPDGSFLHFSKNDGLQENEFNTNTSFETPDGELFFGGVNGVSSFYPDAVSSVKENPRVLITSIRVKDSDWNADTAYWGIQNITLPYYSNTIAFDLAAIGNRTPEQYNYQYQMGDKEAAWVNAGNNAQVQFALQPGSYIFRYYAGNSFEKDPLHAKEVFIIIRPPFWKTAWFITAMIIVLAIAIILITRYVSQVKLKRKVNELEQKKAVYEERMRISREMHDDIGAGLTQITLMSERAKTHVPDAGPLSEIADTSRKLVSSMSEIIWSLAAENNTLEQLLAYLREQLNKLLEYSNISYEIRFPENVQDILLNNAQRRNLVLVTKEIVHNAIKHSKAGNIVVECILLNDQLHFTVTDNGQGFDTTAKSTGHGLRNIRRRIEELQGTLDISSGKQGSRFSYSIPLS